MEASPPIFKEEAHLVVGFHFGVIASPHAL